MSLVLAPSPSVAPSTVLDAVPRIAYWGEALDRLSEPDLAAFVRLHAPGIPHSALDEQRVRGIVGENVSGFTGMPGLEGIRPGRHSGAWAPKLRDWSWSVDDAADDATVQLSATDSEAGWRVGVDVELTREGLVRLRTRVTNLAGGELQLLAVRSALPVAASATELLDLTGRWCRERTPQRRPWLVGNHLREGRHGRTGHDATLVLLAGTPGFGFRHGQVWGTHVAWSGDHFSYAERTPEGECLLGGGELLGPGEIALDQGDTYVGPWLMGAYSSTGVDSVADRLHAWTRRHAPRSRSLRPVVVNTWEATYFDHDLDRLEQLADAAAEVGAERFVLDDGWFRGRRDDRAGLGDWTVDEQVWPAGLSPLIDHVQRLGMDFGLWVEPEMVNEDSDLARAHPDWILRGRTALPPPWRHQQVVDLQVPAAYDYLRDALLRLLAVHDIAFLKWDHNRDLIDVAHDGRPAVHGQTVAFYRLLDELRTAHPRLEIESCASGGARVDLEVLTRTDRVWPSDTIDAVERQRIQRWTSLLVPLEMMGAHLGGPVAHTTGRTQRLGFRAATALLGHFGIEWDLRALDREQRSEVRQWVELYKELRHVVAEGRVVRGDHPDPAVVVTGVVSSDRAEAWYVVATVDTTTTQSPHPVVLPGLDRDRMYRVCGRTPPGQHIADLGRSWLDDGDISVPGRVLTTAGVRLPVMAPESAQLLHVQS